MTSWITRLLLLAAFSGLAQAQAPVIIGAVVSQTGLAADLAAPYARGLRLWEAQVNAAGGLLGRPVELRTPDDGSDAVRAGELYRELIRDEKADLLIGPYGSAATRMAAAEAERERRLMVNGAGPAQVLQQGPSRLLVQSGIPYAQRGAGILQLARRAGLSRLLILARQELAAQEIAEATRIEALALGFAVPPVETYGAFTSDFSAFIQRAQQAQAQGWIAFGEVRDAADMVKTFRRNGYAPQLFYARRAADPAFVAAVGQDAESTLAEIEYDPKVPWPANAGFVKAYAAKWSAPPDLAAAEGYSAGLVLGEAVQRAGTLDDAKVRAALVALRTETPLGSYRIGANGEQVGLVTAVAQIQRGKPALVWPVTFETAQALQPYLPWNDRQVLH